MPEQTTLKEQFVETFGSGNTLEDGAITGEDDIVLFVSDADDYDGNREVVLDLLTDEPTRAHHQYFKTDDGVKSGYGVVFERDDGTEVPHYLTAKYVEPVLELFEIPVDYITALEQHSIGNPDYAHYPVGIQNPDGSEMIVIAPRADEPAEEQPDD